MQAILYGGHVGLPTLSSMKPLALLPNTPLAVSGRLQADAGSPCTTVPTVTAGQGLQPLEVQGGPWIPGQLARVGKDHISCAS